MLHVDCELLSEAAVLNGHTTDHLLLTPLTLFGTKSATDWYRRNFKAEWKPIHEIQML